MATLITTIALSIFAAAVLIAPHLGYARSSGAAQEPPPEARGSSDHQQLQDEKERLVRTLHDIEHDHATGKLDDAAYASTRAELRAQLADVLKKLSL